MKLDAHQHFWRYNQQEYGWITDEMAVLRRDFLPEELAREQLPLGFDGSIAVQARQNLEETRWLLELADQDDHIKGVVGWLDLCSPELPAQLERFGGHPKLRGLRHVVQDEPDDHFLLREDFQRGLAQLAPRKLAYDLLIFPRHLPVACELVKRLPEQTFILDHLAKPFIRNHLLDPWAAEIRALAQYPNIFCKASGMVTEADWACWKPADLLPYLEIVFEVFHPTRVMLGSDWPVCLAAGSYAEVMQVILDFIGTLSDTEQRAVLGGVAQTCYGVAQ